MTETTSAPADRTDTVDPAPIAWSTLVPVLAVSAVAAAFGASKYHLFGDELYFIAAGHHLSVSYADQGPILPLLALLGDAMPGDSLVLFRLPSVLITLVGILLSALIARELGGGRFAQTLTAGAYATSTFLLLQSSLLATNAIDTPLWVAITWLVVRWVRTRQDRLLFAAGVVTAIDMQVKWLIPVFWGCVIVASLIWGPRELWRRPALWAGGAFTVITMVPALLWQAERGWPYLQLTSQVAEESQYAGGRIAFVPIMLLTAGVLGALLLLYGLYALLRSDRFRPYRFLAPAFVLLVLVFIATAGRPYYPGGMLPVIIAAGAVAFEALPAPKLRLAVTAPLSILAIGSIVVSLPFTPESEITEPKSVMEAGMQISVYGQFGWPELTRAVEESITALPEGERPQAIVASSYWQASALQYYGSGLPPVFSPSRGYGFFGEPEDSATTVLRVINSDADLQDDMCDRARTLRRFDYRLGFPTASTGVDIRLCHPRAPWSRLWPELRRM
ncbi:MULTISPECIES: ArnT family glycosyltransferase [Tsukamurella]|uniref:Glycosyltransferase family 39 protein n=2 Tax=Tsukamurella TaxID=2060 RepID=A0A5C5S7E1_9ACTN|nr:MULTISPECIES: glycosyltransferase family 39 protein [Tsukamurella]NMD56689.1 glycosyltransferase family 39 protein [Tsukamurella columbiensis]TWS30345.1 glycosyltransferase family 39 protein [Tsukamurella conjunctivitidis]